MDDSQKMMVTQVEFYMPDPAWKEFPLSTKQTFLVFADQALKVSASGIEMNISSDGKAEIALLMDEKALPIIKISSGIFDRYWEFLSSALKSESGLKLKIKDKDEIYDIAGEVMEPESGRKIVLRFSAPLTEKDILKIAGDEKED